MNISYRTLSPAPASNLMVHDMFGDPPRPYKKTFDGDLKMPLEDEVDLKTRSHDFG